MIYGVQALLLSLTLIFDDDKEEVDFYMIEHVSNPKSVEYKTWKFENFVGSLYSSMEFLYDTDIAITEYAPSRFANIRG